MIRMLCYGVITFWVIKYIELLWWKVLSSLAYGITNYFLELKITTMFANSKIYSHYRHSLISTSIIHLAMRKQFVWIKNFTYRKIFGIQPFVAEVAWCLFVFDMGDHFLTTSGLHVKLVVEIDIFFFSSSYVSFRNLCFRRGIHSYLQPAKIINR